MFSIGDKVVYPMHGAGVIEGIEAKIIGGQSRDYYNVSLLGGNIRLSLPVSNAGNIRLRTIVSAEKATDLLCYFTELEIDSNAPWGKRFKENSEMLKTGIPERAAEVVKTLMLRDRTVGLSTGDRQMMVNAKNIFCSELAMAMQMEQDAILAELQKIIDHTLG